MASQADEQRQLGKGTRTDLGVLAAHFLDPGMVNRHILQAQFDGGLLQEGGFFLHGIDHRDRQLGAGDC